MHRICWIVALSAGCIMVKGKDGEAQCLDDFLAELGEDRGSIEAEAERLGVDASQLIENLVSTATEVADSLIDCAALDSLTELADETGGKFYQSDSPEQTLDHTKDWLGQVQGDPVDLVFLIDTTCSMSNDLDVVRNGLNEIIAASPEKSVFLSAAWFRDRNVDDPWYDGLGAFASKEQVRSFLNATEPSGGGDLPESLYDGTWQTLEALPWNSPARTLVVITDASPLTGDRTVRSKDEVVAKAKELDVQLVTILVGW